MRVTSAFFVAALLRRAQTEGAHAVVGRRGAAEAGAVFVRVDKLDGRHDLYGPAPQAVFEDGRPAERLFEAIARDATPAAVEARLSREMRFDRDLWVVEIEDRAGRSLLDLTKG